MSLPKPTTKAAAKKPATAPKATAGGNTTNKATSKKTGAKAGSDELSGADKAAFLKAMVEGIQPGSKAATKSAAKKNRDAAEPPAPKVEILRRISAAPVIKDTPTSKAALAFAAEIEAALADGKTDHLPPHALQALMTALCKVYAANYEAGEHFPVVSGRLALTGTDVMIVCGALLKAADLQVFELGMWQSWAGR